MAHEIADSDDDLDLVTRFQTGETNIAGNAAIPNHVEFGDQSDPLHNTIFDEFLSPTQRLSSLYDGNQDNDDGVIIPHVLDSSTDRFLNAFASPFEVHSPERPPDPASQPPDSSMGGKRKKDTHVKDTGNKKRARTQVADNNSPVDELEGARKRSKTTYNISSIPSTKSQDALGFTASAHVNGKPDLHEQRHSEGADTRNDANLSEMVSVDARTDYTSPLDLSLHFSHSNQETLATNAALDREHRTRLFPPNNHTSQSHFFGTHLHGGTTSRSSIGNHQSFSISPEKLGVDFDKINPFGSLSQISLPGDLDSEETRGIAEIFRSNLNASNNDKGVLPHERGVGPETSCTNGTETETGLVKDDGAMQVSQRPQTEGGAQHCSPPFSQITNPDDHSKIENTILPSDEDPMPAAVSDVTRAKPPLRKRGRKPKTQHEDEMLPDVQDETGGFDLMGQPQSREKRAGTVDSISNVSEISQGTTGSKNGKRPRSKKTDMGPPELQSKRLPSSDLGLDNKAVIGLSPERYVPRPSRRRGQMDLGLQNETTTRASGSSQAHDSLAKDEDHPTDEVPDKTGKSKRGRKSKVKRAKTSAAALLKQPHDFLDEDEREEAKEVIFMDERPARIKFQPLPDFSPEQKIKLETHVAGDNQDADGEVTKDANCHTKISIDVPVLSKPEQQQQQQDLAPVTPEPKKRGRKRKKPAEETPMRSAEGEEQRPVLADKDTNIQNVKSRTGKPSEQTISSEQDENHAVIEAENIDNSKEQTPAPQASTALVVTPTKSAPKSIGRRTHSPLKPLSSTPLFNVRTRIGLSKRHSIPSLLRKVDRNKEAPKVIEKKERLTKRQLEEREQERIAKEEAEAEGREFKPFDQLRGKDGMLVEWDF